MRHAAIELDYGDGIYTFRLGLGEIEELERKCDLGIFQIVTRLSPQIRTCKLQEISEVIRIGLIGGGTKPADALALVRRYVDQRPVDESRDIAYAVGLAALARVHAGEADKDGGQDPTGEVKAVQSSVSTSPPSPEPQS